MNPRDLDPRLLRGFVAAAEELHFTRAAARLYTAQQALSRDIRRLEQALGTGLFVRTTRTVELTADGVRLLPLARRVLAAHEELAAAFTAPRALLVDLNTDGPSTGRRVLERARELAPDCELMARFESGLTHSAAEIAAGRLDVAFGYADGLDPALRARLAQAPVRYEPLAVLLPEGTRWPRRPPYAWTRWPARPCTPEPGTRGPWSGRGSRASCSPGAGSRWRRPPPWPWGRRSSAG